jgi:catalase
VRSETFADHFSQARQFFLSQTEIEQQHIADAFIFELSKVETPAIRARMVSQLLNVDRTLAQTIADGLRLPEMPKPAKPAVQPRTDLKSSPALSILANAPGTFRGRKAGIVITDGVDAALLRSLQTALKKEGAAFEIIAPHVGGAQASDGSWIEAHQKIDGAPSVLYDAVVLLASDEGAAALAEDPAMRDFVADALAHLKFIGYAASAAPLLEQAGGADAAGVIELRGSKAGAAFVQSCRALRAWERF